MNNVQPDGAVDADLFLSDISPKDKPWDTHRAEASTVGAMYRDEYERYSERIDQCSQLLGFQFVHGDEGAHQLKLHEARFCRVRFCPVCQWRRALRWRARFFEAIPRIREAYPTHKFIFLTLTLRNCPITDLRATLDRMSKAWGRLSKRKRWPATGWVRSVEITRNPDTNEAHPHYHALLMVPASYFGKGYIKQSEWRELWRSSLRLDYLPVINVKRVSPKDPTQPITDAVMETLKYGVKPDDLIADKEWLMALTNQLHKTRAVAVGGCFREFLSEDEPEDLIGESEDEFSATAYELFFGWREQISRYKQVND